MDVLRPFSKQTIVINGLFFCKNVNFLRIEKFLLEFSNFLLFVFWRQTKDRNDKLIKFCLMPIHLALITPLSVLLFNLFNPWSLRTAISCLFLYCLSFANFQLWDYGVCRCLPLLWPKCILRDLWGLVHDRACRGLNARLLKNWHWVWLHGLVDHHWHREAIFVLRLLHLRRLWLDHLNQGLAGLDRELCLGSLSEFLRFFLNGLRLFWGWGNWRWLLLNRLCYFGWLWAFNYWRRLFLLLGFCLQPLSVFFSKWSQRWSWRAII